MARVMVRWWVGALVMAALGAALAAPAHAEPPPANDPPKADGPEPGSTEYLEALFAKKPAVLITSAVLKYGALLIGLVLLVLLYLRWDRIKGGMMPRPPRYTPTTPTGYGETVWIVLAAFLILPLALKPLFFPDGHVDSLPKTFAMLALAMLPPAFLIVFRRRRLAQPRPPGVMKSTLLGGGTFCIATAVVVPVTLIWIVVLWQMGRPPQAQELVTRALEPKAFEDPYVIALYGVLVAPFVEESIFRGMLYPVGRRWLGGTRQAAVSSAVVTAGVFAAIHQSLSAFVPLFALALVLTWVFEKTNSLATVVVAHALNNLTSLLPVLMYHWV